MNILKFFKHKYQSYLYPCSIYINKYLYMESCANRSKYILINSILNNNKDKYFGNRIFYTQRIDQYYIWSDHQWIKDNNYTLCSFYFDEDGYKIHKIYNSINEVFIDIPDLMLL